ncbi:MAG: hypothetical protein O2856_03475, partial [Planctomycetota bacterium]|nr:hypothetical protein [Planctomycetota bacterium]
WSNLWEVFLSQHEQWWKKRIGENLEPAYTLPKFVLSCLVTSTKASEGRRALSRLLSEEDEKAERDFRTTCERFLPSIVGVWRGQPVTYPLLFPVEEKLGVDEHQLQLLMECDGFRGKKPRQIRALLAENQKQLVEIRHQLLGYVGFLNVDEQFCAERKHLRELWDVLPPDSLLPQTSASLLAPPVPIVGPPSYEQHSKPLNEFYEALRVCIQKWNLTGFATWDLPLPQGPLRPLPAGLITQLRGPEATIDFVPGYYNVPSGVDLREELRDRQRNEGEAAGLKSELPLTNISARRKKDDTYKMSAYESGFRRWFVETIVESRYKNIRGAKVRLDKSFAEEFGISEVRVKKLRYEYAKSVKKPAR